MLFLKVMHIFTFYQHNADVYDLYPLPSNKILDWSKLKAFADDNSKVVKMIIYVLGRVENIVGIGENAVFSWFLAFFFLSHETVNSISSIP